MLNCMRRRLGGKISDSKGKRVDAVGRVMRSRPLDPDLFVAVAGGGRHLHRALTIHRCTVLKCHRTYIPILDDILCVAYSERSLSCLTST